MEPFSSRFLSTTQCVKLAEEKDELVSKATDWQKQVWQVIKAMYDAVGIVGHGLQDQMSNHGMRAKVISLLIDAGHSESSIMLRSGL